MALAALLVMSLAGCATNAYRLQSAMRQITGRYSEEGAGESPADTPVVFIPDEEPDAEKGGEGPEAAWPAGVPEVTEYIERLNYSEAGGEFSARFIMTAAQLQAWTKALAQEGFAGEPRAKEGTEVEYVAAREGDNLSVRITIRGINTAWPEQFGAFPDYRADGRVTVFEVYEGVTVTAVLHIRVKDETPEAVSGYIAALAAAGFEELIPGRYAKAEGGFICEFDGDPQSIWSGSTADLYWRVIEDGKG
jgi:hypothetical protein